MTWKDKLQFWIIVSLMIIWFGIKFAAFCVQQSIPCDQGDKCCLKKQATWYNTPTHDPSTYCPLHKMYHHTHRVCQEVREAKASEQENIRKREIELGYVEPPTVTLSKPDRPYDPKRKKNEP